MRTFQCDWMAIVVVQASKFFLFLLVLLSAVVCLPLKLHSEQAKIPTNEILQIWEHSCIKHIEKSELDKAVKNLKVMNWQCDNKKYLALSENGSLEIAIQALNDAITARQNYVAKGKNWICYPKVSTQNQKKHTFYSNIGNPVLNYLKSQGVNEDIIYVIVGQIALETSWGTKIFGNNLFNIKGKYNGESISFVTHEQTQDGQWIQITDSFRKYPNIEESVNDYLNLLKAKWNDAYKAMFSDGKIEVFINGLRAGETGGYATDKSYRDKLLTLYKKVKEEMLQTELLPTYLKCLGRENEFQKIMEKSL